MALIAGITRANYDTTGTARLNAAQNQLQNAIQSNADSNILLQLQKTVDDLKNSIKVRELEREKFLNKLSVTERRVQELQFEDLKNKFDESNQRSEQRIESTKESIRSVSKSVDDAFSSLSDSVFHTLLGPLNLIVNPIEKALGFNLFKIAKKPVADFIEGKFPSTYQKLKTDGGLIGAVGVAIIDAINGKKNEIANGESNGFDATSALSSINGVGIGNILKGAGIVALVAAAITGIIVAWKNEWDQKGIESGSELKSLLQDESASTWSKVVGIGKFTIKTIFGSVVAGIKGVVSSLSDSISDIIDIWKDPEMSVGSKIWDTVKNSILAIPKAVFSGLGKLIGTAGDYAVGLFGGEEAKEKWLNFKSEISNTFNETWNSLKKAFSWDNLKNQWEAFKLDPKQWLSDVWYSIDGFFNNIFSGIGKAISGNQDFDFNTWISDKFTEITTSIKDFFVGWFDKIKNTVSDWWNNSSINPQNWFGGRQIDSEGNETGFVDRAKQGVKNFTGGSWNPFDWNWNGAKQTNDAVIMKDNDLYIPSPQDNIILTKDNVTAQSSTINSDFQNQLMSVLKEIASNLKQPTIVNNISSGTSAMSFEGMRL